MKYVRLARGRNGLGKRHSLWLGDNHLLAVESTGYSEDYARYYLKDIRAITARRTAVGKIWNSILSPAAAVSIYYLMSGMVEGSAPEIAASAIFAVPVCLLLLANIIMGPTCRCRILTPLGVRELPAVGREKSLDKLLSRIRPLIRQFQGSIPDSNPADRIPGVTGFSPAATPRLPLSGQTGGPADASYGGGFHYAAFSLLLLDALFSLFQVFSNDRTLMELSAVLNLALIICIIMALVRQYLHRVPALSGKLLWGALAMMVTGFLYVYLFAIFHMVSQFRGNLKPQVDIFATIADIKPIDHPALAIFAFCYSGLSAFLGAAGLISYSRGRTSRNISGGEPRP